MLAGKNILLGVTGGIAAYKAVEIVSRLRKAGAAVHVIMTEGATKFVAPLTFREISGNPVVHTMWDEPKTWNVEHIALAQWADCFVIAPATANMIGKIASGIADDMLSTTVMAATSPVMIAPAMNTNMYHNPITQQNIAKLRQLGYHIIEPAAGMLACGIEGVGRLPEPVVVVGAIQALFAAQSDLKGKKVLVTAGGTREPIDPVRYIGNRSSGKMGYALAEAAVKRGAQVVLVSGPVSLTPPVGVQFIPVETAQEMRAAVLADFADSDIVIKAAAVADYRVACQASQKIKKTGDTLSLVLEKNPDILAELGRIKTQQILVGFAAETENLIAHAAEKLERKNADLIVANDVTLQGAGFNADTNIVKLLYKDGNVEELPQMAKKALADVIFDKIRSLR